MTLYDWIRNRWYDLRNGFFLYLSMVLSYVNFVLIFSVKFPEADPRIFVPVIGLAVEFAAISVGYLHRRHQLQTDQDAAFRRSSPLAIRLSKIGLKAITGKATQQEIDWAINIYELIENGKA
jgi:hypothetical protein